MIKARKAAGLTQRELADRWPPALRSCETAVWSAANGLVRCYSETPIECPFFLAVTRHANDCDLGAISRACLATS
jgi:hypothetical protein